MTAAEALADIRGYARAGRYWFTRHARQRMEERGIRETAAVRALCYAMECWPDDDDKWRTTGRDRDGEAIELVVAIEDELIVITLY